MAHHVPSGPLVDDYAQAGALFRLMAGPAQDELVMNIAGHLGKARTDIQKRQIEVKHIRVTH